MKTGESQLPKTAYTFLCKLRNCLRKGKPVCSCPNVAKSPAKSTKSTDFAISEREIRLSIAP